MFVVTNLSFVLIGALLFFRTNLPGLLMASMVLQAGSVLNLVTHLAKTTGATAYGVTFFHAVSLFVIFGAILRLLRGKIPSWPNHLNWPLCLLLLYALVAIAGALILPISFTGALVNDLIKMYGSYWLSPLAWNFGHAVQIVSLILILTVLLSFFIICQTTQTRQSLMSGVLLGCAAVILIGGYEQAAQQLNLPSAAVFWANNPGYHLAPLAPAGFVLNRIGLPFSEPSYASAYMSAMLLGSLSVTLLGRSWWWWLPGVFLCSAGLVNTLGSTGLVAAGFALVVLLFWVIVRALKQSTSRSIRWRSSLLCALIFIVSVWGVVDYKESDISTHVNAMVKGLIVDKMTGRADSPRRANDIRALELLKETYGLGVGMGSHRASSFFAALLANTGVAGFLLFMGMLLTLLWRYWKAPALSDTQIFVAAALPTATLAMGIGIPDLNMPMYWGFIFLGFIFCPDELQMSGLATPINDVGVDKSPLGSRS